MRERAAGGNYEIVGHLATGGMAELFLARARGGAGPYVVLKRILADHARRSDFVSMFLDEARLSARLHHPNIAQVLDVGRAGHSYFYTMEYVHGRNLREVLERMIELDRYLPIDAALAVLIGAAAGLHAAHEQRDRHGRPLEIVHRDVSPSNVMVGFDGVVKIVDFGVATAIDHVTETRAGVVKGKTAYLSPEQCTLRDLDRRCDVFALGIVAHELLTRSRLFRRPSEYETMHAILHDRAPAPSSVRGELPPELDAIVLRALAKDRDRRYASAAELQLALTGLARRIGLATCPTTLALAMRALFGDCPEPWLELEQVPDTAVIRLSAFDRSSADDEPTDPDADAIDLAMARMRPSGSIPSVVDWQDALPPIPTLVTRLTPPAAPPASIDPRPTVSMRTPSTDDFEPTERTPPPEMPTLDGVPTGRWPSASQPPPFPGLAMGTLRTGPGAIVAARRPLSFPVAAPPALADEPSEPEITMIASEAEVDPASPRSYRRALGILVGAAIGGAAIAMALAMSTC